MAKTNLSKLQENFTCLAIVCVDHIKLPLMDILDNHIKPPDLYSEINSSTLISANKLRPDQKKICYITPPGIPDYNKFDVTLLYTLIRNLCPSLKPSGRWGEEPAASHTQLGDDIERLRLFRNEQFAHANSAEISDGEFNKLWTDLQTVINRIQSNKKAGCKTDYLQTFKSIEKRLLNCDDLEKYKLLLEATIHASKQREDMDGPDIWIEGSEEAVCGSTAHFQANVKERKVSFLSVNWKKLIKNESTPIDTSNKKFWGITNKELFIESVCKEDEGEYQAVLSFEEDRIGTTIKSNVIFLRVVGGIPTVTTSHETCLQTHSVKLIGNVFVIDDRPVIDEIYWTKNGNKIDTQGNEEKFSKVSVDVPSLTIYNVNQYDAGRYTLTATNAAGTTVSETIVLGAPDIVLGESKEESDGSQIFTFTIKSIPAPYNVQWQVSDKNSDMFTTLDENAKEYRGTSHSDPHPVLVVRLKELLKNNIYQIEVQNFVGGRRKKIPSILNMFYKDRGAGVMFAKLFNDIAELFPERKLDRLQDLILDSCKDKDKELSPLIKNATSAREYLRILKDKELFTPSDVIFMQFLLRETNCGLLNDKCIAYAKTQKALCFYEEPIRNGYKKVQFHVQGNISNYTADQIGIIKESVAAIIGCDNEEIHLNGFYNSDSFFVVLSMKEKYVNGLFNMKQQDKKNLIKLNIDYFIIDSGHIYLKNPKAEKNKKSDEKLKMVYPKMLNEEEEFQLLHKASCLPRYTYHWSLVEWYMEGLPKDIIFTRYRLESCLIIIGGIITDEEKKVLFGESALSDRQNVKGLQKEAENYTAFLIVYFFNGDLIKMGEDIEKLDRILPLKDGHGHVLVVMEMKHSCDRKIIIEGIRKIGITKVEVVMKTRSIIVRNITCILEQMLSSYLVGTKKTLLDHSHTHCVDSSLLEVNAILKRLKQAKCYPEPLAEIVEPEKNEIDNILQRFPEKIIYSVQDGNRLYIIASDQATKMSLETLLSGSGFQNISLVVTVEDKLPISELSKTGVPLHGAKFVYVNLGKEAFNTDECFATTGSLMQANNNSLMVAVTCRHALEKEDHFYTLIENSLVRLGEEVKQPNNNMERLHDDISVVRIDDTTRSIVDEKCEKLLIDTSKCPSPARISDRTLVKGDIVHKRGARTGLTTGIVKDVRTQKIGRFSEQSPVIFITGRDSIPFAEKGDSGSLVFQHSLDPEEKRLDVLAMVQGKVNVPIPNADVICFPFIKGCENLQSHIPDIHNLDFFNH